VTSKHPDEADRQKSGTLPTDPKDGTKVVSEKVPRVLTVRDILTASRQRALSHQREDTYTTGHYRLDQITGGLRRGFSWLVGADTSWGKSSWLVSLADENIKLGRTVLIVSFEDTEEVYGDRLMVRRSQVNAMRYRDQKLFREEMDKVVAVEREGQQVPVFVDARRWNIEDLAPHLERLIRERKVDIVAFDYIQEIKSSKRWQDERVKFREIASVCRHLTKNAKVAGIIFSQLTLDQDVKIPTRKNIRECRDIANASEVILIGFEPEKAIEDRHGRVLVEAGEKCVLVDKVKNGPRGAKVPLSWSHETASFNAVWNPDDPPPEQRTLDDYQDDQEQRYP
jgi:replicative DNA helicase